MIEYPDIGGVKLSKSQPRLAHSPSPSATALLSFCDYFFLLEPEVCMQKVLLHFMEKQEEKQGGKCGWLKLSTLPRPSQSRDLENFPDEAFSWNSSLKFGLGLAGFEPRSRAFLSSHPGLLKQEAKSYPEFPSLLPISIDAYTGPNLSVVWGC